MIRYPHTFEQLGERPEAARRLLVELRALYLELGEMDRAAVRDHLNQLVLKSETAVLELRTTSVH